MRVATFEAAWHARTCAGHTLGGDAAVVLERDEGAFLGIVDGLGHGAEAHAVAREAVAAFRAAACADVSSVIQRIHRALRRGLGAAAGACWYDGATGDARWAAVGNVVLKAFGAVEVRIQGQEGLLGHLIPTLHEHTVHLAHGDVLLLATDGVRDRLSAQEYPGLFGDSAAYVARRIVERFGRDYDDATCVALRRSR